jgi:hypothetical protein
VVVCCGSGWVPCDAFLLEHVSAVQTRVVMWLCFVTKVGYCATRFFHSTQYVFGLSRHLMRNTSCNVVVCCDSGWVPCDTFLLERAAAVQAVPVSVQYRGEGRSARVRHEGQGGRLRGESAAARQPQR